MKERRDEHMAKSLSRMTREAEQRELRLRDDMEKLRIQQEQTLGTLDTKIDSMMERRTQAIMDRLDGLLGNRSGSKKKEPDSAEPSREARMNFNEQPHRRRHMDSLEGGAVHPAMPQGTIGHGAQTSEEVRLATDRPQTNDRRKTHMRLGDVIPGAGVMQIKKEVIPVIRIGGKIQSLYQGVVMLKRGIQGTRHQ